jgi:hypothetical protein
MFDVPKAAFAVFRKGKAVANPEAWKSYAMAVQMLVGLMTAVVGLLRANGYELPVSDETLQYLAGGIAGLWFGGVGVYHVITSPDRGLPPRRAADAGDTNNGDGQ